MHPVLVQFSDSFFIGTYGVMIALGVIAAVLLAAWQGRRRGFNPDIFFDLAFVAVLSGFLGARVLYILLNFGDFLKDPVAMLLSRTGFVFLGGLISATAACTWYVWKKGLDFWKMADLTLPSVALGHAFGRIGCHLAGCCYGGICHEPHWFAVHVPRISTPSGGIWPNAYYDQLEAGLIDATALHSLPIWPVQLMESLSLFILVGTLVAISLKPVPKGLIFGLYLVCYGTLRFALEFLRGDEERGLFFGGLLSTSQLISAVMIAIGVVVVATSRRRELFLPTAPVDAAQPSPSPDGSLESRASRRRAERSRK